MSQSVPSDLLQAASAVWERAYAPYSQFQVGAALRTSAGTIVSGANVENASYGLSRCAEQSAILAMVASGERSFDEIVVYTTAAQPSGPCGACRQILHEFGPEAKVYLVNHQGIARTFDLTDLLPAAFGPRDLASNAKNPQLK